MKSVHPARHSLLLSPAILLAAAWPIITSAAPIEPFEHTPTLEEKVEGLIIPEIEVEDIALVDLIPVLRNISKDLDPKGVGFNILFKGNERQSEQRITISAKDLPMEDLLYYLTLNTGLTYRFDTAAIVIAPRGHQADMLETRFYPVSAGCHFPIDEERDGKDAKVFFEEKGVTFPPGSTASFVRSKARLVAHNTQENLRRIERILVELGIWEPEEQRAEVR
jgi:hypothetical protein